MLKKTCLATTMCFILLLISSLSFSSGILSSNTASAEDVWAASEGDEQYYIVTDTIYGKGEVTITITITGTSGESYYSGSKVINLNNTDSVTFKNN